jgi:hypothetical protein
MRKVLILIATFCLLSTPFCPAQTIEWTQYINGSANDSDIVVDLITDVMGNVYIVGTTKETGTFYDVLTAKYNSNGNLKWSRTYSMPDSVVDMGFGVAVDGVGNVYSLGYTNDSGMISVIKYNSDGEFQWANNYIGELCHGKTIAIDNSDHIIVVGLGLHIARFGPDGDILFIQGGTEWEICPAEIIIDNENNCYVFGYNYGTLIGLVAKYDSLGNEIWRNYLYDDCGLFFVTRYVAGAFDSNWNVIAGGGHGPAGCAQTENYFLRKYSPDGDTLWTHEYIVTSGDGANVDILVDNDTLFTTGIFLQPEGVLPAMIKYSPTGALLWDESYDRGVNFEYTFGGCGALTNEYLFNIGYSDSIYGAPEDFDIEVVCYHRNGSFQWAYHTEGVGSFNGQEPNVRSISIGCGIAALPDNNIVFAAVTDDSPSGTEDIIIRKISLGTPSNCIPSANCHCVDNLADSGPGSLRQAILDANSHSGLDTIGFNISGVLTPDTQLPDLTDDSTNILAGPYSGMVIINGGGFSKADEYGLTISSNFNVISGLVFTDWTGGCVKIDGDSNIVTACNLGVNALGTSRDNRGHGLVINGNFNDIGGCGVDDRNLFGAGASAALAHVLITGDSNTVVNSYMGIATDGNPMSNVAAEPYGIKIDGGNGNIIGDENCPNYLGGFNSGFLIQGSDQNIVKYNRIGLSPNMTDTIPCSRGMYITTTSSQNIIGPGNIVAGSYYGGIIMISSNADSNVIIGNTIVGNHGNGISATSGATANRIGGYTEDEKNIISRNQYHGINIDAGAHQTEVIGNIIEYNGAHGLFIRDGTSNNVVELNTIRNNSKAGMAADSTPCLYNTFSRNLVYSNAELGIDLREDGVTFNDPGDIDTGPNDLLNYPEIDSLFMNPDSSFRVYGQAANDAIIEFFVAYPAGDDSKPADTSGHGEAWEYIGSDTADGSGNFEYEISNAIAYFSLITTTCTDASGNTSEFSPNFRLVPTPLIIVGYSPINLHVIDPAGDSIGKYPNDDYFNSIGSNATYEDIIRDSITIQYPLEGEYIIIVYPQGDPPPGALYTIGIRIDGSQQAIIVENQYVPVSGTADTLGYEVIEGYHFLNGDPTRDNVINLIDILYLIAYLYGTPPGPAPYPITAGDANCDQTINLIDILYLISHLYGTPPGPEPCNWENYE